MLADIGRARDILRELAQLSNADERRPVDLLELWRKVAAPLSGSRVRVEVDSSGAVPAALANLGQTERILSSVVAAEVASNQRAGSDVVVRVGAEVEGERVVLTVRSSAPPYSLEARKRILNPFFLRNPEALGEGMGFAVCSRIAQTQGGSFALDGRDGTREYRLELPKVAGAVASTSGGAAR
ncbi:MAG: ATP-binding protein, partial [Candidatus Binatia bacterium]